MGQLFDVIRQLIAEERYIIGQHASERLEERGIMEWQVVAGVEDGERYGVQGRLVSSALCWCRQAGNRAFFRRRLSHAYSWTANQADTTDSDR